MTKKTLIVSVGLVASCLLPLRAQGPALQEAMQTKLSNAEALLAALVQGDFGGMGQAAESLSQITDAEIASWQTRADPEYTEVAADFLLAVDALRMAAAGRELTGALREYQNIVAACTNCHTTQRGTATALHAPPGPRPARAWLRGNMAGGAPLIPLH